MNENLRLVALPGRIAMENGAGFQAAIIMRQPATGIQITDSGRIVKQAPEIWGPILIICCPDMIFRTHK